MADEARKDFNAIPNSSKDMPKIQISADTETIAKNGGSRMYFAPPLAYDALMRTIPPGRPTTVGIFVSIAPWAGSQRENDEAPHWRTLKAGGELSPQYPAERRSSGRGWKPRAARSPDEAAPNSATMSRTTRPPSFPWTEQEVHHAHSSGNHQLPHIRAL